jgi:hypothetical protein
MEPYIIEFYYQGECIEQRKYDVPPFAPQIDDVVRIDFQNSNYSDEDGNWWAITERRLLFFSVEHGKSLIQTLMLNVVPDKKNGGMWKSDPLYK